ncbi:MAG: kstR 2 [Candidatus Saccharibacteria bacterium]|nr:kstR 2 [Candidatus Saccharibacteria bacterium]
MSDHYLRTTPVHKRSQATIQKILNTAEAAFLELGYDKVTTRIIAERAGVPTGSLYHFFPNKNAILDGLAARHLEAQKDMHQDLQSVSPTTDLEVFIDLLVDKILIHFESHAPFERIINARSSSSEIAEYVKRFNEEALNNTIRNMAAAYPSVSPDVLKVQAETTVALVRSLLDVSTRQSDAATRAKVIENMKVALHAIWEPLIKTLR